MVIASRMESTSERKFQASHGDGCTRHKKLHFHTSLNEIQGDGPP